MTDDTRSYEEIRLQKLEERQKDMIHKAELRELVEKWRRIAPENSHPSTAEGTLRGCADELEQLLDGDSNE